MRTYKCRIYPTKQQQEKLWQHSITLNRLHNYCIEKEQETYTAGNKFLSGFDLNNLLPELKTSNVISEHLKNIHSQVLQQVTARVALAYKAFFKKTSAHPKFRSCRYFYTLCYPQSGYSVQKNYIHTKVYGDLKGRFHRKLQGVVKQLGITCDAQGHWYVLITTDYTPNKDFNNKNYCGVDLGITNIITTSDGDIIKNDDSSKRIDKQLNVIKSIRDKKYKKGSRNFRHMSRVVNKLHGVKVRKSSNFLHKVSKDLSSKYGVIAVEALNIKQMSESKVTGLNREIRNTSWSQLISYLKYKCNTVVEVNPHNTSKTCNVCGHINGKMPLHKRTYKCPTCGLKIDRDINAAINIAALGRYLLTTRSYDTKISINDIDVQLFTVC